MSFRQHARNPSLDFTAISTVEMMTFRANLSKATLEHNANARYCEFDSPLQDFEEVGEIYFGTQHAR